MADNKSPVFIERSIQDEEEGENNHYNYYLYRNHDEENFQDDHHIPYWILALIGTFVAALVILPNILTINKKKRRIDKSE